MKYRIYIDEVGNPDLGSSDNPNHRFLSLTGVIIELGYVQEVLQPEMEAIKASLLSSHPDEPIILHRKEILNAKPPFEALRHPDVRERFDRVLLEHLTRWDFGVVSVCLDKKRHKEQYTTWRYDPYHYCLKVLVERFVFFLEQKKAVGDVMAESRGGKEDIRLKMSFRRLWEEGTGYLTRERFQGVLTSCELKVKSKANNIAGLQLADLVAHPSRNEILHENGLMEREPAEFARQVIALLKGKYYQDRGRTYGKKML